MNVDIQIPFRHSLQDAYLYGRPSYFASTKYIGESKMNILEIKKAYFEGILTKEQVEKCLFVIDSISLLDEALTLKNKENISLNKAISKIKKRYRTLH